MVNQRIDQTQIALAERMWPLAQKIHHAEALPAGFDWNQKRAAESQLQHGPAMRGPLVSFIASDVTGEHRHAGIHRSADSTISQSIMPNRLKFFRKTEMGD